MGFMNHVKDEGIQKVNYPNFMKELGFKTHPKIKPVRYALKRLKDWT